MTTGKPMALTSTRMNTNKHYNKLSKVETMSKSGYQQEKVDHHESREVP